MTKKKKRQKKVINAEWLKKEIDRAVLFVAKKKPKPELKSCFDCQSIVWLKADRWECGLKSAPEHEVASKETAFLDEWAATICPSYAETLKIPTLEGEMVTKAYVDEQLAEEDQKPTCCDCVHYDPTQPSYYEGKLWYNWTCRKQHSSFAREYAFNNTEEELAAMCEDYEEKDGW